MHSPTPWTWDHGPTGDTIRDASEGCVCSPGEGAYHEGEINMTDADRDFLLRAVNNHYELLAALRAIMPYAEWAGMNHAAPEIKRAETLIGRVESKDA